MISSIRIVKAAALCVLLLPLSAQAMLVSGDISGGGSFSGSVTRADGWVLSNPVDGQEVNFWTLSGYAGDSVSIFVNSNAIEFGMSLYQGEVDEFELIFPGFNNTGDFADNILIASTPGFATIGTQLLNIILPASGIYTLAVGGESFAFGSEFAYNLGVEILNAPVPVPAAIWLLVSGLAGLGLVRRRRMT